MNTEYQIAKQIAAAKALRETLAIALGDDADTMRDMIEGETSLHEAIASVMASIREDEMMSVGIGVMMDDLKKRLVRLNERISRKRTAVEQAMIIGELRSLELPDATLTIKAVPPKLEIVDEASVPAKFWFSREPELDRKAIKAALKDGEAVPGATLGNGSVTLQIRRS